MQNKITIEECQKLLEQNPFGSLLQMKIKEAELGRVRAELPFKKEFTNIYGDLHGGVLYSAVDTICGIAAGTYGYYVTTVDGQIRYLKAARATEYVTCTAKVVKPGRNITVVSFEIMDSNGMLLNTGDFTFYNLKEKEIKAEFCMWYPKLKKKRCNPCQNCGRC